MVSRSRLEDLRTAVLGTQRGREVEVAPDGQVVLDPAQDQALDGPSEQESPQPRASRMSPHTFGL